MTARGIPRKYVWLPVLRQKLFFKLLLISFFLTLILWIFNNLSIYMDTMFIENILVDRELRNRSRREMLRADYREIKLESVERQTKS